MANYSNVRRTTPLTEQNHQGSFDDWWFCDWKATNISTKVVSGHLSPFCLARNPQLWRTYHPCNLTVSLTYLMTQLPKALNTTLLTFKCRPQPHTSHQRCQRSLFTELVASSCSLTHNLWDIFLTKVCVESNISQTSNPFDNKHQDKVVTARRWSNKWH